MPDLVSRLIVELTDRVSGPAGKAAKSLKGIGDASKSTSFKQGIGEVNKLADALKKAEVEAQKLGRMKSTFHANFAGFKEARAKFRDAQTDVQNLARKLQELRASGGGGIKGVEKDLNAARRLVKRTALDFKEQSTKIKTSLQEIGSAGGLKGLETKERMLGDEIRRTNAAMERQRTLAAAQKEFAGARSPAAGSPRGTSGTSGASGGTGIVAGTRRAVGWLGVGYGVIDALQQVFEFERQKALVRGQGGASDAEAEWLAAEARNVAVRTGLASPTGALMVEKEFLKAGLSPRGAAGAMGPALELSRGGDTDPESAGRYIISAAAQFKLAMDSVADARKNARRIADALSYAANETQGNVDDFGAGLKFAGGAANLLGLSPEQAVAALITMVRDGQTGAEAGTALRSFLVSTVKPTADGRQAMAELGLNFSDYAVSNREFTPEESMAGMMNRFGPMKKGALKRLNKALKGKDFEDVEGMQALLTEFYNKETGSKGPQDKEKIASAVAKFLQSQNEELDFDKLLGDLNEKGATLGQIARIFQAKHGSRLISMLLGDSYQTALTGLEGEGKGEAARASARSTEGIYGDWTKFTAAMSDFLITVGDAGALSAASGFLRDFAAGLRDLSAEISAAKHVLGLDDLDKKVRKYGPFNPNNPAARAGRSVHDSIATPVINFWDWLGTFADQKIAPGKGNRDMPSVKLDGAQETRSEAQSLSAALISLLGITVSPLINQDSITAAIGKVQTLRQELLSLNSSVSNVRGVHADTGPGGGTGW